MSFYYNNSFANDPLTFVNNYTVDIKTWFETIMRVSIKQTQNLINRCLLDAANKAMVCHADLEPTGGLLGYGVENVKLQFIQNGGFNAYWVPYHSGTDLPGYADIPRDNPACNIVLTAGMNGCAFVITDSPKGKAYMRVYHNQHPEDDRLSQDIINTSGATIAFAGFDEYGGGDLEKGQNPLAFNCMFHKNGEWYFVFQPQSFNALSLAPAKRLSGQASMRKVFK